MSHFVREEALAWFKAEGLPTRRMEAWKYTDVSRFFKEDYQLPSAELEFTLAQSALAHLDAYRIVLCNGRFVAGKSNLPAGVTVTEDTQALPQLYDNGLHALHAAFSEKSLTIRVQEGTVLDKPLHWLVVGGGQTPWMIHPHVQLFLEEHTLVTLIEEPLYFGCADAVINQRAEITLAKCANLNHIVLQRLPTSALYFNRLNVLQKTQSAYSGFTLAFSGRLIRNDVQVALAESHAETRLYGLCALDGSSHVDNDTEILHQVPHTTSLSCYKNLVDDTARAVFTGRVKVEVGAHKTSAHQECHAILLGEKSESDNRPQLEILNDDVVCSHGATVGQLEKESLFYLRARGIDEKTATRLLLQAFAMEVVDAIPVPFVKNLVKEWVSVYG